jgi:2-methylcitrate dehydratase PrpD
VDGSLGVRLVQGFVAEAGVTCTLLARAGLTGPANFIGGIYGYRMLYARGERAAQDFVAGLGRDWWARRLVFKKFPSCGATQGLTQLALDARQALSIDAPPACARIERIEVRLPPYAFRLVGRAWRIGTNPRVDAQFSARYCAASALVRGASRLTHFRSESIDDADIAALIGRIDVQPDPAMDARGHSAVNLAVRMRDGRSFERGLDIAPGFPGNGLSAQEHRGRFDDCIAYARHAPAAAQVALLLERIATLESMPDARRLLEGLVVSAA